MIKIKHLCFKAESDFTGNTYGKNLKKLLLVNDGVDKLENMKNKYHSKQDLLSTNAIYKNPLFHIFVQKRPKMA